jgi:hypothetical protein
VEQGAEDIDALAGATFMETVFKYPAPAGFPIKKLTGRRKVNGDCTGGTKGTGVTALPAAVTEGVPVFSPFPVFAHDTEKCFYHRSSLLFVDIMQQLLYDKSIVSGLKYVNWHKVRTRLTGCSKKAILIRKTK